MTTPNLRDVNPLMNSAKDLADQPSSVLHELIGKATQEEILFHDTFGNLQPVLSLFEVEIQEQILQKASDGITVLVFLHLDNLGQIFDVISVISGTGRFGLTPRYYGGCY